MAISIRSKFVFLGSALVFASFIMAFLVYENLQLSAQGRIATVVIQRHMDADMKHDGIRGNVYQALLAAKISDPGMLKDAQGTVNEMSAGFAKNVDENLAEEIPGNIRSGLD